MSSEAGLNSKLYQVSDELLNYSCYQWHKVYWIKFLNNVQGWSQVDPYKQKAQSPNQNHVYAILVLKQTILRWILLSEFFILSTLFLIIKSNESYNINIFASTLISSFIFIQILSTISKKTAWIWAEAISHFSFFNVHLIHM